jgi:hypothetical protein
MVDCVCASEGLADPLHLRRRQRGRGSEVIGVVVSGIIEYNSAIFHLHLLDGTNLHRLAQLAGQISPVGGLCASGWTLL